MTTTDDEEGAMTVPQWILKMYPQQTTVILYEAILNGRLALLPDDIPYPNAFFLNPIIDPAIISVCGIRNCTLTRS